MATKDDTDLGTAIIFLTEVWELSAADGWMIVSPQSRPTSLNSAGSAGRRLIGQRRKRQPPYSPVHGQQLCMAHNLYVLAELLKLRRADAQYSPAYPGRLPRYTRGHRRLHRALNLVLLEQLHGMTRAEAWRALEPQSEAVGASAAAEARREVGWYRKLHGHALNPPARSEPDVSGLPPFLAALVTAKPAVELVEAWYARMLKEQAERAMPELWLKMGMWGERRRNRG